MRNKNLFKYNSNTLYKRGSLIIWFVKMSELEIVVRGHSKKVRNLRKFKKLCENEHPLVAIQIPRGNREEEIFVAYFVKGLKEMNNGYIPLSDSHIYNAIITKGTIEEKGDWVLPPMNYPVVFTEEEFKQGKVVVLNPKSNLGTYIQRFFREGRPIDMEPLHLNFYSRFKLAVEDLLYKAISRIRA